MTTTDSEDISVANVIVVPPDGKYGWVVVAAAFYCIFVMEGITHTFSLLVQVFENEFNASVSQITLANSLTMGFSFMFGPIAGTLSNRFGFRPVIMTGSVISSIGIAVSIFVNSIFLLYLTYGIVGGVGFSMMYANAVLSVGFYFEKWRGLATGIATSGTGIGMLCIAPSIQIFLKYYTWRNLFLIYAGTGGVISCALIALCFRPIPALTIDWDEDEESRGTLPLTTKARAKSMPNTKYPTAAKVANFDFYKASATSMSARKMTEVEFKELLRPLNREYQSSLFMEMMRRRNTAPQEVVTWKSRVSRFFSKNCKIFRSEFCKKCWRTFKPNNKVVGSRPFYRDDIFYEGSIQGLPDYRRRITLPLPKSIRNVSAKDTASFYYHMSVSRLPTFIDLFEEKEKKCICCPESVKRTLKTFFDPNIFKIPSFLLYVASSSFLATVVSIPMYFIMVRSLHIGVISYDETPWLISSVGITNALGRVLCGYLTNFRWVNVVILHFVALLFGATLNISVTFFESKIAAFVYAVLYGFVLAEQGSMRSIILVKLVGLENLSNAFGIFLLFLGTFTIIGAPSAGVVRELTGSIDTVFYYASSLLFVSAISLFPTIVCRKKLQKYQEERNS